MELNDTVYEPLAMSNSDSCKERILPALRKKKRYRKTCSSGMTYQQPSSDVVRRPSFGISSKLWIGLTSLCLLWLILLTWFAVNLHFQFNILKGVLTEVAAGSQGVPDALQKCHSWSRQLQANQTLLFTNLASLSRHLENITLQIGVVQGGLSQVEEKLISSPELINVPQEVHDLSSSVASFGSLIEDLQTSFNKLKEEQSTVIKLIDFIKSNVTNINETLTDFTKAYNKSKTNESESANTAMFEKALNGVQTKMSNINDTVSHRIKLILEDQHKDHMAIEALEEMSANITSRLTTLHNDCSGIESLSFKTNNISTSVLKESQRLDEVQNQLTLMVQKINTFDGKYSKIISEIAELKTVLPMHLIVQDDNMSNATVNPSDKSIRSFPANGNQTMEYDSTE